MTGLRAELRPGNLPEVVAARRAAGRMAQERLLHQVAQIGLQATLAVAPSGPTGNFVASIDTVVDGDQAAIVTRRPPGYHSHLVDGGRSPGKMPPPKKIAAIFGVPLAVAYPIARSIGRSGTRGHNVFERAADIARGQVRSAARDALSDIARLT